MKFQMLRKTLIKYSIIMLLAVLVSSVIAYSVFSWSSGLQQEAKRAQSRLNAARGEVSSRESENKSARNSLELYRQITGESEQAKISDLSRDKAQFWLKDIAKQNDIVDLEGSFDPVTPIASTDFKKTTLEGISSLVKLNFAAMTDVQIYRFIEAVLDDFPGYVKITAFTLERTGEVTDSVLRAAGRGEVPKLVKGTMEFYWVGVREVDAQAGQQQQQRGF